MRLLTIFLCSPRQNGTTDQLAGIFGASVQNAGIPVEVEYVPLRNYAILPCKGCNACFKPACDCLLAGADDAEKIFRYIFNSSVAIFATPIYFYALPAHFKALIDRSQRFWAKNSENSDLCGRKRPAIAIMAAGRTKGEELFTGAMRTLRWFGRTISLDFAEPLAFRGLEGPEDISGRPDVLEAISSAANLWARRSGHEHF